MGNENETKIVDQENLEAIWDKMKQAFMGKDGVQELINSAISELLSGE